MHRSRSFPCQLVRVGARTHARPACVLALLLSVLVAPVGAAGSDPTLLVLGDSLSAGYGFDPARSWVRLLQDRLAQRGLPHRVVNASISGDTTRGARARLPAALEAHDPDIAVVALGGNDGLRGLAPAEVRDNLVWIIRTLNERDVRVLLAGMRLPPNYGPAYTRRFEALYRDLAERLEVAAFLPFLLEGVAGKPELMQADGIHPRAAAQPRILDNVWTYLQPLL